MLMKMKRFIFLFQVSNSHNVLIYLDCTQSFAFHRNRVGLKKGCNFNKYLHINYVIYNVNKLHGIANSSKKFLKLYIRRLNCYISKIAYVRYSG